MSTRYEDFISGLKKRNPHQTEFHQAVEEFASSVFPIYEANKGYCKEQILERLTEPDRIISFRVSWEDDEGNFRANRAWRVQFNKCLGPYKGGLRFHPDVNESVLKFLGFEQIFKNALTGLPMGGAKGGSNFNPKGKSDREVMRFCQSLMTELHRYIGEDTDVPAGDIGVGTREISYLFGHYIRMENRWVGVLTGKGASCGGSAVRKEATGWGCMYFCEHMLNQHGEALGGQRVAISGAGNVALYAAHKAMEKGAKVITMSDSDGYVHIPEGLTEEQWHNLVKLKEEDDGRISEFAENETGVTFHEGKPWGVSCEIAMPCATQNELDESAAETLINNGVVAVCEGANMPCTAKAVERFRHNGILFGPGKAANAGGVAVSGFEQSQNAIRVSWSREEVDERLQSLMKDIHNRCVEAGSREGQKIVDYADGANIAAFQKVATAMHAYGVV
ncbi:MAG: NADP-specific glutamate dehydrogenase [Verrucomicrobiales bacterium]|nr:NADP-specific glutamate dehydrogenase [Verrucomicrobiales bacterium]